MRQVALKVPAGIRSEVTVKHYRAGEDLLHDPNDHLITVAPLTEYHGWFGPRVADQADMHAWKVACVYALQSEISGRLRGR